MKNVSAGPGQFLSCQAKLLAAAGPANFTLKLVRPGFGSAAELPSVSPA